MAHIKSLLFKFRHSDPERSEGEESLFVETLQPYGLQSDENEIHVL